MYGSEKKSWTSALFAYAEGEKSRLLLSVVLSVLSVMLGLVPFYCMYRLICLMAAGTATAALAVKWCLLALAAYAAKVVLFGLSTGTSHAMAYTILEGLRLRLADRFGVSDQMAAVRLESLRYEIACALEGQSPDTIELLSVREQQRRGIQTQSLEEKARLLFAKEQEYHRRLRNIDI